MIKIKIFPAYIKTKKHTREFIVEEDKTLSDIDKLIRNEYKKDEDNKFDFNDSTHLSGFYVGNRPHKAEIKSFNVKIRDIFLKYKKLKYVFDLGEQNLFCMELESTDKTGVKDG